MSNIPVDDKGKQNELVCRGGSQPSEEADVDKISFNPHPFRLGEQCLQQERVKTKKKHC